MKRAQQKYSRKNAVHFYAIIGLFLVMAVTVPLVHKLYIYPSFVAEMVKNTENEAIRTGRHMASASFQFTDDCELTIDQTTIDHLNHITTHFQLWKVKIFDASGKTIFSSDPSDIGKINTHDYFVETVAKGEVFSKVVQKEKKSLEGQVVPTDVVETYVPILREGKFVGAFELYYEITERKQQLDFLVTKISWLLYAFSIVASAVALFLFLRFHRSSVERAKLEKKLFHLATTDQLTGVNNRARFEQLARDEIKRYKRYKRNTALLIFDVDHFKRINDTYGHPMGDEVLATIAQTCKSTLREIDIIGRYGGEEFIALLTECDRNGALHVAERTRMAVQNLVFTTIDGTPVQTSISMGLTTFWRGDNLTLEAVVQKADQAMYRAKNNGRNQVVVAETIDAAQGSTG